MQRNWGTKVGDKWHMTGAEFDGKLRGINCLAELYGFANRRMVLMAPHLPKWSDAERAEIIAHKFKLLGGGCGKCDTGNKCRRSGAASASKRK